MRRILPLLACLLATPAVAQQRKAPAAQTAKPVRGAILQINTQPNRVEVVINLGVSNGVAAGWKGLLLRSRLGKTLPGLKLQVIRATELDCTAYVLDGGTKVAATVAMLQKYPLVELRP